MQTQISWLLQKPTDLDLNCLQRQDISGFSRTRVKWLTSTCAHSFTRNWQLPFLNQRRGKNDHRKYFMITLHDRIAAFCGNQTRDLLNRQTSIQLSHWVWLPVWYFVHSQDDFNLCSLGHIRRYFFAWCCPSGNNTIRNILLILLTPSKQAKDRPLLCLSWSLCELHSKMMLIN